MEELHGDNYSERYCDSLYNRHGFQFGDVVSRNFGVYLTGIQIGGSPERDVSFLQVAGRNGDLMIDNKRWKNIDVTYSCAIMRNFADRFDSFKNAILAKNGYQRLSDSIYPKVFREGILKHSINPESLRMNKTGRFDLIFNCKPQRFIANEQYPQYFTGPTTYWAASGQPARPIITIHGTGPGTLTIGDVTVEIKALTDHITLDCDLMTAYRQEGDAPVENKNRDINAPEFPELRAGENKISWTGGITQVDIIPRGWIL